MRKLPSDVHIYSHTFPLQICSQIPNAYACCSLACTDRLSFFLFITVLVARIFLHIGYRTVTLDCQNKGTYLDDACSYSGYYDFYDSLEHEYHTAVQYLEFEPKFKQLQITAKTKKFQI